MPPSFLIRPFLSSDYTSILLLSQQFLPSPINHDHFEKIKDSASENILVACDSEQLCGFLHYQHVAGQSEIIDIVVASTYRRLGVGKKLFDDFLDKVGDGKIFLEVASHNRVAQLFYKKLGFHHVAVRKSYYRDGSDALMMVKEVLSRVD